MTGSVPAVVTVSPRVLLEVRPAAQAAGGADTGGMDGDYPPVRSMRIFAVDSSIRDQRGGIVTVAVPFELLNLSADGKSLNGQHFAVVLPSGASWEAQRAVLGKMNPNSPANLASQGYAPSLSDPRFIVQMVYAVASQLYQTFRRALGREIVLGLMRSDPGGQENWRCSERFELHPWAVEEAQAWYDRDNARIAFGYFKAKQDTVGYPPDSQVFTALSHDVIVHEMTHALLDAVKPDFITPTNRDVLAFHEAFADLITIFQRFSYSDLVADEIRNARADIGKLGVLNSLARTFAVTAGIGETLRPLSGDLLYDTVGEEPHELGNVLVQAVYRAFQVVATRRIAPLVEIASNGSGVLPPGALSPALAAEIADRVRKTATIFQTMLIRALDYCPPYDITFFTFLRAVITADMRMVPVDEHGIRAAWMEAFRHHRIFPKDGLHYAEEQLAWQLAPERDSLAIPMLSFAQTAFAGNPGELLPWETALIQASKVAAHISDTGDWRAFLGIDEISLDDTRAIEAQIVGLRSFARPGPSGMTEFGTVVEVIGRNITATDASGFMMGVGACLIFDSEGRLSSCAKRLDLPAEAKVRDNFLSNRRKAVEQYSVSGAGARSWLRVQGRWTLRPNIMQRLCVR